MKNKVAIVVCVHGNEQYGLEVCKKLPAFFSFFVANEKAVKENKRFIEGDLNRCFPGNRNGNHEERLAYKLVNDLSDFDYVIDLHSTSQNCPLFGIITKPNEEKIKLAKFLGVKKLVIVNPSYASGKALIDFVKCGISLEVGPHCREENFKEALNSINLLLEERTSQNQLEIYKVFGIIKGNVSMVLMENFQRIKKGQPIAVKEDGSIERARFDFIAVLTGKKNYNNVIGLACKMLSKD